MQDVNIYIETSIHGPTRKNGGYIYLLECMKEREPVTRSGWGGREKSTENRLALEALAEALGRLNCPCELRIYTDCQHILNAMENHWARQWQKNDWKTAKGIPVKNADVWGQVLERLDPHLYSFWGEYHSYRPWLTDQLKKHLENQ